MNLAKSLMGSEKNFFNHRAPSIQKSKILKYSALITVKGKETPSVGYTPAH
jgi:hypothetical protein